MGSSEKSEKRRNIDQMGVKCTTYTQLLYERGFLRKSTQRAKDARESASQRGYGVRWRRIRLKHLQGDPLCSMCAGAGRITAATEVHHILPLKQGGTHNASNLQSLCKACHNKIPRK